MFFSFKGEKKKDAGTKAKREERLIDSIEIRTGRGRGQGGRIECSSSDFKLWGLFSRIASKDQITRSVSIKFC